MRETLPHPRTGDDAAVATFIDLEQRLLDFYGVRAESRHIRVAAPDLRIHVLDAGDGDPVVILHGGDGEGVDWAPLMARLQDDVRLIAVDRPGFGLSDPFDYRRVDLRAHAASFVGSLLDALGLETATLMGGSMGGFFSLVGALEHPERVHRVVLVGMPLGLARVAPWPLRIVATVPGLSRMFMKKAASGLDAQREQYRQMFGIDPDTIPELYLETRLAGVRLPGAAATWAVLLRRVAGLRGMLPEVVLTDDIRRITQPVLLLWGDRDMAPVAVGRQAAAQLPDARFEALGDVGHFPFLQVPDRCAALIREFLGVPTAP
jgi:pimeloyl-ACP methyl ester carboxylesterase